MAAQKKNSDKHKPFNWQKIWHYLHHVLMAAVIASCTLLVEKYVGLDWLDAISLRAATAINLGNQGVAQESSLNQSPIANAPITILIDDAIYENYFDQSSPLNRGKLVSLIEPVLAKKPTLLAIDLDLAPGANDRKGDSTGQLALDHLLDGAARGGCASFQGQGVTHGCQIVLAMPLPVVSESLQKLQFDWVRARCAAGIQFAETKLISHQGTVIRHFTTAPSLGNVSAWWLAGRHGANGEVAGHGVANHNNHDVICQLATKSFDATEFFGEMNHASDLSADTKTSPLNMEYFAKAGDAMKPAKLGPNSVVEIPAVSDKVVFLGGGYGKDDKFVTAAGERDGVAIHAATFFSGIHGVDAPSHFVAWMVDVLFGLMLGIFFESIWRQYGSASKAMQAVPLSSWKNVPLPSREKLLAYVYAKFWLILNFFVLLICIGLFLWGAGWLLSKEYWLNPGPIMIGMFIDSLLSSRSEKESHEITTFSSLLKEHPDMFWQIPFVIIVITYLLFFFHH